MKESILTEDRILTGDGESLEHAPEYRLPKDEPAVSSAFLF